MACYSSRQAGCTIDEYKKALEIDQSPGARKQFYMRHWILLSKENSLAVWIVPEGDQYLYEIAPTTDLKKGDTVYLWSNPHSSFFGWGDVAETPRATLIEVPRPNNDIELKQRTSVLVNRRAEFRPPITEQMMMTDANVRKLTPTGFDDVYAIPLRPGQANY